MNWPKKYTYTLAKRKKKSEINWIVGMEQNEGTNEWTNGVSQLTTRNWNWELFEAIQKV